MLYLDKLAAAVGAVLEQVLILNDIQRGIGGGARQRRGSIGSSHRAQSQTIKHVVPCRQTCRKRAKLVLSFLSILPANWTSQPSTYSCTHCTSLVGGGPTRKETAKLVSCSVVRCSEKLQRCLTSEGEARGDALGKNHDVGLHSLPADVLVAPPLACPRHS